MSTVPLKRGRGRSVILEHRPQGGEAGTRIVKRFQTSSGLARLRDRSRARREFDTLVRLHALGLPVPRPMGLERVGEGWEVAMEWLEGTVPLSALLESDAPDSGVHCGLAGALGRLLAELERAQIELPDLHAGNVLVDSAGKPWLVDFHAARPLRRPSHGRTLRRLAGLAAGTRERLAPALRARVFLARRARLKRQGARTSETDLELVEAIEARSRLHRRSRVVAQLDRWLRESSRAYLPEQGVVAARELSLDVALRLLNELREGGVPALPGREQPLALEGPNNRALTNDWSTAARLIEHRLPSARPLLLDRAGSTPRALFALPPGTTPLEDTESASAELSNSLGGLLGGLHDRGLWCMRLDRERLWRAPGGRLHLGPGVELLAFDPAPGGLAPARRLAPLSGCLDAGDRPEGLRRSYVEAFRGTAGERRSLARELGLKPR